LAVLYAIAHARAARRKTAKFVVDDDHKCKKLLTRRRRQSNDNHLQAAFSVPHLRRWRSGRTDRSPAECPAASPRTTASPEARDRVTVNRQLSPSAGLKSPAARVIEPSEHIRNDSDYETFKLKSGEIQSVS
jgi:hypothetical protein